MFTLTRSRFGTGIAPLLRQSTQLVRKRSSEIEIKKQTIKEKYLFEMLNIILRIIKIYQSPII